MRSPEGQALLDMLAASTPTPFRSQRVKLGRYSFVTGLDQPISNPPSAHCALARGHKGPHVLLNPR